VAIKSYDLDGVIHLNGGGVGLRPSGPEDVIITGRSEKERQRTEDWLAENEIQNEVFFSPDPFSANWREQGGKHKTETIMRLWSEGREVLIHFEDDPIQADMIRKGTAAHVALIDHGGRMRPPSRKIRLPRKRGLKI